MSYSPLAVLITLLVGATLATVPIFVSLYRLPGDMVAGGCNSLVLSAACHAFCPVPSTEEAPDADEAADTDDDDAAEPYEASGAGGFAGTDETEDALLNNGQDGRRRSAGTSSSDNGPEEQSSDKETQPSGVDNDDGTKKALIKLTQSKLRWGVVPLTPELCKAAKKTGQDALHLSFATEETFISPPVAGELYM